MAYNPEIHHRRSIRLKGYDYSQEGLYYITICVKDKLHLFGKIENGKMIPNDAGIMVETVWKEIPIYYPMFALHNFVVMPNHIHGILEIISDCNVGVDPCVYPIERTYPSDENVYLIMDKKCNHDNVEGNHPSTSSGESRGIAPTAKSKMSIFDVVHRFKTMTTKRYTDGVKENGWQVFNKKLWQRNYYEHIIRNDESYLEISEYIQNNPMNWLEDEHYESKKDKQNDNKRINQAKN
ncbi:MAG: transposase [Leptospiraceae bacterium]|nr:transposase [Leptospiraceae bacterium]